MFPQIVQMWWLIISYDAIGEKLNGEVKVCRCVCVDVELWIPDEETDEGHGVWPMMSLRFG